MSGLRLDNQPTQDETEHDAKSGGENTHNEDRPPCPPPLALILPKPLNHLRLLRREVHGEREVQQLSERQFGLEFVVIIFSPVDGGFASLCPAMIPAHSSRFLSLITKQKRQRGFDSSCGARVGRVSPLRPLGKRLAGCGAHGVTRPTLYRNLFVTVLAKNSRA